MYENFGDVNFFEHGVLVDTTSNPPIYRMLRCEPYSDTDNLYLYAHLDVDISADWIDRKAVTEYAGLENFSPIEFAVACTEYYSWEEFLPTPTIFGYAFEWNKAKKQDILKELKDYPIDYSEMQNPFEEE